MKNLSNFFIKIGKAIEAYKGATYMPVSPAYSDNSITFSSLDGSAKWFKFYESNEIAEAFEKCPPVPYIISKIGEAICNGKIDVVNRNTLKPAQGEQRKDYLRIIERPNFIQNRNQFLLQLINQCMGYGFCVVLKNTSNVFDITRVSSMWALPSQYIRFEWKTNLKVYNEVNISDCIKDIYFDGVKIDKTAVGIFTDDTYYTRDLILPVSRLCSMEVTVNNLIQNFDSRNKLMKRPMGVLSPRQGAGDIKAMPLSDPDRQQIQKDLSRYGLKEEQFPIIATKAALDWTPISFPIQQMGFDWMEKNDTITLSEGFGYPSFLLGISENAIHDNVTSALKSLYENKAIPYAAHIFQQLDEFLGTKALNCMYVVDYSHIACMQENQKEKSEVLAKNVVSGINAFKNNMCNYTDLVKMIGISEPKAQWTDKWWFELLPEEQALFESAPVAQDNNNQNNNSNP